MDIKKDPLADQLYVKQDVIMPQAKAFNASYDIGDNVTVEILQNHISVSNGDSVFYYHHNPGRTCAVEMMNAKKIKMKFNGVTQQVMDNNRHTIDTGVFNLTIIFTSYLESTAFIQQLTNAQYTIIEV